MQRKNYILNTSANKNRAGFAMMMAIIVIVIIATIMALSLSLTVKTAKKTTDIYLYEQAVLYSKSAAELALLDIAENNCQDTFNTNFGGTYYDANVTMRYIYTNNTIPATCTNIYTTTTPVTTDEQNGSVLMDITITINDPLITSEPIRYFRRSIQKL